MRTRIYETVEQGKGKGRVYDFFMMATIVASLVPLAFKDSNTLLDWADRIAVAIFIVDYILRLITADLRMNRGKASFALYLITPMAIIDLLCILPSFSILASGFRILKIVRLFRSLRVFRTFKTFRYSRSAEIIINVIQKQGAALMAVFGLAVGYMLVSALIMFNVEPDTFDTFFDAVYWAAISLTTIGYGDIAPLTPIGRLFTIISAFVGIAIIALPSGIITAGFMDALQERKE